MIRLAFRGDKVIEVKEEGERAKRVGKHGKRRRFTKKRR
jgi:hypothetical protein